MSAAEDMTALALRCEQATRADRELDEVIAHKVGTARWVHRDGEADYGVFGDMEEYFPSYTASLDDAVTLVTEGFRFLLDKRPYADGRADGYRAHVWQAPLVPYSNDTGSWAATPALALTAAALRARAALAERAHS